MLDPIGLQVGVDGGRKTKLPGSGQRLAHSYFGRIYAGEVGVPIAPIIEMDEQRRIQVANRWIVGDGAQPAGFTPERRGVTGCVQENAKDDGVQRMGGRHPTAISRTLPRSSLSPSTAF